MMSAETAQKGSLRCSNGRARDKENRFEFRLSSEVRREGWRESEYQQTPAGNPHDPNAKDYTTGFQRSSSPGLIR